MAVVTGARASTLGDDRLRVLPWRGDPTIAYLVARRGRPTTGVIEHCLVELRAGYRAVLTAALPVEEHGPYVAAGFAVHERLHLLRRPVDPVPPPRSDGPALARGRRRDRADVLAVDGRAFPPFWRLDDAGLDDALTATPSVRFRVARDDDGTVIGYAVTGRAGGRGYLQRLAVDPGRQRRGTATALVGDGLRWLRRWGTRELLVNTQEDNAGALALYEGLGFTRDASGLAVLHRSLQDGPRR